MIIFYPSVLISKVVPSNGKNPNFSLPENAEHSISVSPCLMIVTNPKGESI